MEIAGRLFGGDDNEPKDATAEQDMRDLLAASGVPFDGTIGWDYYDGSLEIFNVEPSWRITPDLQQRLYDEGFIKVYVNHTDEWETHYHFGTVNGFQAQDGWRVSYPHKRTINDKQIWVEKDCPSWPRDWFSGEKPYVIIKTSERKNP